MERIRQLIREVLSTPPKKESCNCGCHSCENVGNKGPVLNESLNAKIVMTENMQYHVTNKLPLTENTFRYGSQAFLDLWAEARYLYSRNAIHVNDDDKEILLETNLGEYGMYEGKKVPLDLPMLEESQMLDGYEVDFFYTKTNVYANIEISSENPTFEDNIQIKGTGKTEEEAFEDLKQNYEKYKKGLYEVDKKKTPPIGKPKRGGSKKFYVYVRDKGKIKKVSFGDTSGLSAKINNPKARKAFAARHDCKNKTDRTKASYWSCNIGKYWKSLGGSKNFYGYW
jgi:predicted RNase H-like HicB family nuclease